MSALAKVRKHYDERRRYSRKEREQEPTIDVRRINNFVKTVLLYRSIAILKQQVRKRKIQNCDKIHVLDLCCGHGSDVIKYGHVEEIKHVHFVDLSAKNIADTMKRVEEQKVHYTASYSIGDVGNGLALPRNAFDVIVCHFAVHYLCNDTRRVQTMLNMIQNCAAQPTVVVFTMPHQERVRTFSNDLMSVVVADNMPAEPLPAKYHFNLKGAIAADEWVVWRKEFVRLVGLHCSIPFGEPVGYWLTFPKLLNVSLTNEEKALAKRMRAETDLSKVSNSTRECVEFYTSFTVIL